MSPVLNNHRGFTLIELLVAISIVAILSAIGLVVYSRAQVSARDYLRKSDLRQLASALEIYYQQNRRYIGGIGTCSQDTPGFYSQIAYYLTTGQVPQDPSTKQAYCYISENGGVSYRLFAKLENCQDSEIIQGINCQTAPWNYSIVSWDLTITPAP